MPNRSYRRRVVQRPGYNNSNYINRYILRTDTTYEINNNKINDDNIDTSEFEQYICDIIKNITNEMNMTVIRNKVEFINNKMASKKDVYDTLDLLEQYMMSIVDNINRGVSIGIIQCRIEYIRNILKDLPCEYIDYDKFGPMILQLLNTVTGNLDIKSFITKINSFKTTLINDIEVIDQITEIEEIICSIIGNIKSGTSIGIIRCRIEYLQNLINDVKCG
jgi:hypothetical protein